MRCGEERGAEERWCCVCGLDFAPTTTTLPTAEALSAADRERAYFEAHPELLAAQEARAEEARRELARQELARLSKVRPTAFAEYRDVSWRARLARGWLVVVAALTVLTGVLEVGHLNLLAGKSTADLDLALAQRIDDSNATLGIAYLITLCAYLFSAAFFIVWTFRAYKNTAALGAQRPRFRPGWAIGGWFVPVVALYRPKEIVNDIWRASDPDDPPIAENWRGRAVPRLLDVWWAVYLIGGLADRISARLPSDTVEHDRTATGWGLVASIFTVTGAFLAFAVVTLLTRRQRERAAVLQELPVPAASEFTGSQPTAATAPGS
jgi:protein-S-isoprenylcysteine O-methyltransferase Ste14